MARRANRRTVFFPAWKRIWRCDECSSRWCGPICTSRRIAEWCSWRVQSVWIVLLHVQYLISFFFESHRHTGVWNRASALQASVCLSPTYIMDAFEDENPFDTESDRIPSETSSTSKVDLSEPPSPPFNPSRQLSSEIIDAEPPFPSQGSHRQQSHLNDKIDFCCARDRVLHSGDDIEILVRQSYYCSTTPLLMFQTRLQTHKRPPLERPHHISHMSFKWE